MNKLFRMPPKAFLVIISIIIIIAFPAAGTVYAANDGTVVEKGNQVVVRMDNRNAAEATQITLEKAKEIALNDSKQIESNVTFTTAKLEYDDNISVYDIEFYTSTHKYEYEINAATGAILEKNIEQLQNNTRDTKSKSKTENKDTSSPFIGVDQAKTIAVNHAGLSLSDVTFTKVKFETEDGKSIYDIEFYKDGIEYDYEVDASTGEILNFDRERDD
jgi:uncharacterized membrane protein YkoI